MNYEAKIDTEASHGPVDPFNPLLGSEDEERRAKRRIWILALVAALVLLAVYLWLHRGDKSATESANRDNQAPLVTVMTPGRTTIAGKVTATGTLAARRELPVGVPGEGGQIARVLVEPGDWVSAGQILATIDRSVQAEQTASLAAQIQVAQADARLAQANLDRALKLVDRGFISKADLDRLTASRDSSNARVRVSRAQLGEMQARVRRLDIVAPAAGLVLERMVEPGQVVSSGSGVLFRLAKGGEMELKAMIGEVDLAGIAQGVVAEVTPVGSGKVFSGEVWQVAPVIDPQSRQGTARIALAYAPELKPGGFATAVIRSGSVVATQLPDSALLSDGKVSYVYIVGKDNKVARREVKTGTADDTGITILSGLDGSERVVLRSGGFLSPGETVKTALTPRP